MKSKLLNSPEVIIMAIVALIILVPLLYGLVCFAFSDTEDLRLSIERPDKKYEKCVRDTGYMRINHMDLLKEVRNEIVREGKRGEIELNNCRKCHTSRERFCDKCHNVASVHFKCFDCHYYPK